MEEKLRKNKSSLDEAFSVIGFVLILILVAAAAMILLLSKIEDMNKGNSLKMIEIRSSLQ